MSTEAYQADVAGLAGALMELEASRRVAFEAPDAGAFEGVDLVVHIESQDARTAIVLQQLLQLSVDAAAVAVANLDPDRFGLAEWETEDDAWLVDLSIVELGNGSFFARFSINPKTKAGRSRILAILGVAVLGLTLVLPAGLTLVAGAIVAGLGYLNTILTPDELPDGPRFRPATVDADDIPESTPVFLGAEPSSSGDIVVDGALDDVQNFLYEVRNLGWVGGNAWLISSGGVQGGSHLIRIRPVADPVLDDLLETAERCTVTIVDPPLQRAA